MALHQPFYFIFCCFLFCRFQRFIWGDWVHVLFCEWCTKIRSFLLYIIRSGCGCIGKWLDYCSGLQILFVDNDSINLFICLTGLLIHRYKLSWSMRPDITLDQFESFQVIDKRIKGNIHRYTITNLQPNKTYKLELQAIILGHEKRLRSKRVTLTIRTPALTEGTEGQTVTLNYLPGSVEGINRPSSQLSHRWIRKKLFLKQWNVISRILDRKTKIGQRSGHWGKIIVFNWMKQILGKRLLVQTIRRFKKSEF